ncbi:MAG TPA: HAD family hydrolase [Dehalococcoidia bacterium]|nr:HAD family hydrolase [Dehalococcoidia bacterium]
MTLQAVIFDLGDTLWPLQYETEIWPRVRELMIEEFVALRGEDSAQAGESVDKLRASLGRILADTFLGSSYDQLHFQHYVEQALERSGMEGDELAHAVCQSFYLAEHRHEKVGADRETVDMLAAIRARGLSVGLVSNTFSPGHFHQLALNRCGAAAHIDVPVYSGDMGFRKPDPRIYRHCLDLLGVPADATLFVGDRLREDVVGPQAQGMRACQYRRYRQEEPRDGIEPDFVADSPAEVLQIVEQLSGSS